MRTKRPEILVIDDSEDMTMILSEMFGYSVRLDVLAGISAIEQLKPTHVFCDIEGIQAGGKRAEDVIELCQLLGIPVICISSNVSKVYAIQERYGIDATDKIGIEKYLIDKGA